MASANGELGRKELGDFIRSRRRKADPSESGIPASGAPVGRRRVPGLRREEVAQLSGVSLTWYTWLEQGRNINVSRQVLNGIARALALDPAERVHLFRLAGEAPEADGSAEGEHAVGPALQAFLEALNPNPAYLISRCFDILAWNHSQDVLLGGLGGIEPPRRNVIWMMFNSPDARAMLPDWEAEARWLVGLLRAESAHEVGSPRFIELVRALQRSSPQFHEWWTSHDVYQFTPSVRRFRHPVLGELSLNYLKLGVEGDAGRSIVAHFAQPGSVDEKTLRELLARKAD